MNDKELADAAVALHVACRSNAGFYYLVGKPSITNLDKYFVRDPRVALLLLENVLQKGSVHVSPYEGTLDGSYVTYEVRVRCFTSKTLALSKPDESLPRAITEAAVEALK